MFRHARSIPLAKAIQVAKDAFVGAAERDIYTGDCVEIYVIQASGVTVEKFSLRRD